MYNVPKNQPLVELRKRINYQNIFLQEHTRNYNYIQLLLSIHSILDSRFADWYF